ncbi:MAG: alcohol dehydrogenase [Chloroflexi bacterium]|jgi:L-iditol 2-dehydrogenase|nr:alcohol dehydrogenase [Chloroflexota bacterium]MCH2536232.1 zinc-dependent dehydrogenase [Dehalococcoidia bacterium]MEE2927151.1 zinc-dependent dehydrogenase [Chloroflexota bacterium]HIB12864.1 alcohol dehydrogenase [Dehalococcoidia bacterium]|tara:strand:- start:2295 stop:3323 length:1029 start_codon:yes stop_codon:yes gene_type:complete
MRVAMYYNNHDVRLEEMPVPEIGPGELLLKVEASGLCGSDVMEWYRIQRAPMVLGHEVSGEVVQVGAGVDRYKEGDRMVVTHHVPCNACHWCLNNRHTACDTLHQTNFDPGGFSEYLRIPQINVDRGVFPIPDHVPYEEASITEPLACVYRGQKRANLQPGQNVLVLGSGLAGLLHINLARALGAGRIIATDMVDYRLQAARRLGADTAFPATEDVPARLREANDGRLADLVIVCTGALPALNQALQSVERGGTVLFFAPTEPGVSLPVSINDVFFRNDVTLTTTYAGAPADLATALEMIGSGRVQVGQMISHRLGLAEAGLGFKLTAEAGDSLKVIIQPQK